MSFQQNSPQIRLKRNSVSVLLPMTGIHAGNFPGAHDTLWHGHFSSAPRAHVWLQPCRRDTSKTKSLFLKNKYRCASVALSATGGRAWTAHSVRAPDAARVSPGQQGWPRAPNTCPGPGCFSRCAHARDGVGPPCLWNSNQISPHIWLEMAQAKREGLPAFVGGAACVPWGGAPLPIIAAVGPLCVLTGFLPSWPRLGHPNKPSRSLS